MLGTVEFLLVNQNPASGSLNIQAGLTSRRQASGEGGKGAVPIKQLNAVHNVNIIPANGSCRRHTGRLITQQGAGIGQGIKDKVIEDASLIAILVQTVVSICLGVKLAFHPLKLSQHTGFTPFHNLAEYRMALHPHGLHQKQPLGPSQVIQLPGLTGFLRKGLLAEYVPSCLQAQLDILIMTAHRRGHIDQIHLGILSQLLIAAVAVWYVVSFPKFPGLMDIPGANGIDFQGLLPGQSF